MHLVRSFSLLALSLARPCLAYDNGASLGGVSLALPPYAPPPLNWNC